MNSEEIAKLANVSRSTVSRVINNYKNVPLETRLRVQKVIDEYGYTPNASARTLAGKANNIIGLFIADINTEKSKGRWIGENSPYNLEIISHVIESCKRRGYLTLVYTISHMDECYEMKQYFANRTIYGGIFIGFPYHTKELEELAAAGYNIVLIDQLTKKEGLEKKLKLVNTDNIYGGYLATKYLLEHGHEIIAHVTGDYRLSSLERCEGYKKALLEAGKEVDPELIVNGQFREDLAYKETKKLFKKKKRPTAVYVANDIMAIGVVRALNELGLKVPEDVSIVGFDNLDGALWLNLNLTTLYTDLEELAERSVVALFRKEEVSYALSKPKLIERTSVARI